MQVDERMIVKGLIHSQLESIRNKVNSMVDEFYEKKFDPVRSLDRQFVTDLISDLNHFLYSLGVPYDN